MKASIVDLRYRMKEVLRAVERGETVTVLYRGKEKAQIVPFPRSRPALGVQSHRAFGLWKNRRDLRETSAYLRRLRQADSVLFDSDVLIWYLRGTARRPS